MLQIFSIFQFFQNNFSFHNLSPAIFSKIEQLTQTDRFSMSYQLRACPERSRMGGYQYGIEAIDSRLRKNDMCLFFNVKYKVMIILLHEPVSLSSLMTPTFANIPSFLKIKRLFFKFFQENLRLSISILTC